MESDPDPARFMLQFIFIALLTLLMLFLLRQK